MLRLVKTCGACPEQYDAFDGDEQVGYLRLRHGNFTVEMSGAGGELVLEAAPKGDGVFDPDERGAYLRAATVVMQLKLGHLPDGAYEIEEGGW